MKRTSRIQRAGFTLAEVGVASGVYLVVCAAMLTGVVALQRLFSSTTTYTTNHASELRISDYLARDLREALSFSQTGSGQSIVITMKVPRYYDSNWNPITPVVNADGSVTYTDSSVALDSSVDPPIGPNWFRVQYYIQNSQMYREVDNQTPVLIAKNVANFFVVPLDSATDANAATDFNLTGISGKVAEVKVQVNFTSKFGTKSVTQSFYNTTLMRNPRSDVQTNLY
jgi:hypothetical protein